MQDVSKMFYTAKYLLKELSPISGSNLEYITSKVGILNVASLICDSEEWK